MLTASRSRKRSRASPTTTAIAKYGTDKPDLRNPIEMQDVTEHFRGSGFKVFAGMIEKDPKVARLGDPRAGRRLPRLLRPHELLGAEAKASRASATSSGVRRKAQPAPAPSRKNIGPERADAIHSQLGLEDRRRRLLRRRRSRQLPQVRRRSPATEIGHELKLIDEGRFALAWIVDFPMYEWNEDDKKIDFSHNPFSMPQGGIEALDKAAAAGNEAISRPQGLPVRPRLQWLRDRLRLDPQPRPRDDGEGVRHRRHPGRRRRGERFGGLYRAFQYGAPPHGGMAAGIERIVMLLTGCKTVREVALFPMNQQADDLLMDAPSEASPKQLRELSIRVVTQERK